MTDGMSEAGRNEVRALVEEIERIRLAIGHLQLAITTLRAEGSRSIGEHLIRHILVACSGLLRDLCAEIASRKTPP